MNFSPGSPSVVGKRKQRLRTTLKEHLNSNGAGNIMRRCALSPDAVIAKRDIRRLQHTVRKFLCGENEYFLTRLEIGYAGLLISDYLRARRYDDFLLAVLVRHGQCLTIDPCGLASHRALVIVLLGKSQFEKPSAGCTFGGKMRIAIAFWLPSGCGEAVMARYEPSFMSESGAFTTSLTGALSASLTFISPPSRAFAVKVSPSTLAMVARTRTDAGVCAVTIEAVKRKAMALA